MMIQGLNHITFGVANIEVSTQFYTNILGGKLRVKWAQGAYIEFGTLWLALNVEDKSIKTNETLVGHIAFSVSSDLFESLKNKLIENGVQPYKENKSEGLSYYFKDPDGHNLEIHVGDLKSRIEAIKALERTEYTVFE